MKSIGAEQAPMARRSCIAKKKKKVRCLSGKESSSGNVNLLGSRRENIMC